MMRTYELPYAIGEIVLNVRADFISSGLMDHEGRVLDLPGFELALVSSLKKPIVIHPGEDVAAALAQGHELLMRIRVWVVMEGGRPVRAGFRRLRLGVEPPATVVEYVIEQGDSGDVQFSGTPQLTRAQQEDLFLSLGRDLASAEIFDDEPPAVASALRDMLDRR